MPSLQVPGPGDDRAGLSHHQSLGQNRLMSADPLRRLLDAAKEGDNVAVAELVRRTQAVLFRACAALGSPGEEEDLVQETYLRALRSMSSYRGDAPVQVWLLSIARHVCADHVRRRQRQRRLVDRIVQYTTVRGEPAPEFSNDLLDVLDRDRREAFVLTQLIGLTYDEAALAIGCPVGTIRSRVSRARSDLLQATQHSQAN